MKKSIILVLALCQLASWASAQSFNPAPGFTATELFNLGAGKTISALDANAAGDLFYLVGGDFGADSNTRLFRRTAAAGYADETELHSFASPVFGSFVRESGGIVYFGESSTGSISRISSVGGSAEMVATVAGNYDLKLFGGSAYLSADPTFSGNNKVYALDLFSGALDTILDTPDFSGPIAFDSAGNLLYGATSFGGVPGGIYSFTAAQVAGARDADPSASDTALTIGDGALLFDNGSNQYLALLAPDGLFAASSPFGQPSPIIRHDLLTSSEMPVGATGAGEFFGGFAVGNGTVFAAVSVDFLSGPSAVFAIVPEPSGIVLLGAGALVFLRRRRSAR